MSEHNFRHVDIDAELVSNREDRRDRMIGFAKRELVDALDKDLPKAHIDSQRLRLAHLLGIVRLEEPGSDALREVA